MSGLGRSRVRRAPEAILVGLAFAFVTAFFSLLAIPFAILVPDRGVPIVARRWARAALAVAGVEVELERVGVLPAGAVVVMANHTSHFDVVALYAALPIAVRMVAKRELTLIPIFGWALALGGAIIIDRGKRERAIASIERAGKVIRRGASVVLFPEGTRTPPGILGPLKKGPFHLAQSAQVAVLPIGVVGTGEILKKGDWRIHPGRVRLCVGEPVGPFPGGDSDTAREALMGAVAGALTRLGNLRAEDGFSLDTAGRDP